MSKRVLPMFSSKSFIESSLTFRFLIHFEFIFVYGGRQCSNFILLHVAIQFSQHHLQKRLSFFLFLTHTHCILFLQEISKVTPSIVNMTTMKATMIAITKHKTHSYYVIILTFSPVEETVFSPLYILASFVIDQLTIGAWVYLWAFYPVPLIYISVLVPVPYCLDYCSFVVQFEVREPDSPNSVFLSQDCFGYLGSFAFPFEL